MRVLEILAERVGQGTIKPKQPTRTDKKRIDALEGRLVQRPTKARLFDPYNRARHEFSNGAGEYWKYYQANHKPSSRRRIEVSLMNLCEAFGGKRPFEIDAFLIERYKTERKGKGKADATVNRELSCLKNLFNMGIRWRFLSRRGKGTVEAGERAGLHPCRNPDCGGSGHGLPFQ